MNYTPEGRRPEGSINYAQSGVTNLYYGPMGANFQTEIVARAR